MGGIKAAMLSVDGIDFTTLLKPFNWQVWVAFLFLWLMYGFALYSMSTISKRCTRKLFPRSSAIQVEEDFSFCEAFWCFSLVGMQYGVAKTPKSVGGKILQMCWCVFFIIFTAAYTANLVEFLGKKEGFKPLKSIDEIVDSGRDLIAYRQYQAELTSSRNGIIGAMIARKRMHFSIESEGLMTKNNSIGSLREKLESGVIWISYQDEIAIARKHIPNLYELEGFFSFSAYGILLRKKWPYARKVRDRFLQFGKSGYFDELRRKYTKQEADSKQARSITFDQFYPAVIMMMLGALGSIFLTMLFQFYQFFKTHAFNNQLNLQ